MTEELHERHGNVALVRINRPGTRNALDDAVCAAAFVEKRPPVWRGR